MAEASRDYQAAQKNIHEILESDSSRLQEEDFLRVEDVEDRRSDRGLKESYARWFIAILIGQLVAMNVIFVLVGVEKLAFADEWVLRLFMSGTLAEVFGVIYVIAKYLFRERK